MSSNLDHTPPVCSLASRYYETEHDLERMQGMLMEARSRTGDWRYWHVGELVWGFFMVACHLNPCEQIRLWHNDERKLVGNPCWEKIRLSTARSCQSTNGPASKRRRWRGRKRAWPSLTRAMRNSGADILLPAPGKTTRTGSRSSNSKVVNRYLDYV